ncbi:MAG TPA: hypothetical protein VGI72_05290 [Gaiellales bacterium]
MAVVVAGLHAVGFFLLIAVAAPHHYRLGESGAFTTGVGLTAYTLGLRHAFDADHIAAIDTTTRKLMAEGRFLGLAPLLGAWPASWGLAPVGAWPRFLGPGPASWGLAPLFAFPGQAPESSISSRSAW